MKDLEKLGAGLLAGENGEKLKALAGTPEARKLGEMVDAGALRAAAEQGDTETLSSVLSKVLQSSEGKKLAAELSGMFGKK